MRFPNWEEAIDYTGQRLRIAPKVHTGHWQGVTTENPAAATRELLHVSLEAPIPAFLNRLVSDIKPNQPWADAHFEERVGGVPVNPPPSYKIWPWTDSAETFIEGGKFAACYPERFWPKIARTEEHRIHRGIQGLYGDLGDVVNLLRRQPFTRQAYLPLFHPDETGAVQGGRIMCSLGYWFVRRADRLHVSYQLRSCDFHHHFRDDLYLAARLAQWMIDRCEWADVLPGDLSVWIGSLHIHANDMRHL
jgi:hypothetical protein